MKIQQAADDLNGKFDLEERAYRSIIRMIIENEIKPGDVILETDLAETLEISRTPVRQALGKLVAEGFLEKKRKKGYFIPLPNPDDAKQVFLTREVLEGQAAAEAAVKATRTDTDMLGKTLEKENDALASYNKEGYSLANEKFHFGIVKTARNPYLERYCRHIFWRSNVYIFYFDSFYSQHEKMVTPRQLTPVQHARILKAIVDGNPEQSSLEMKKHIRNTFETITGFSNR